MEKNTVTSPKTGSFEFQNWPVYENALEFVAQAYRVWAQVFFQLKFSA
jgi:hypothetical protein